MYPFWADVISGIHLGYVSFVVLGILAITIGIIAGWRWARNPWLRWAHLIMTTVVAVEAVIGVVADHPIECPFTTWEVQLRSVDGKEKAADTFVGRLLTTVMFPDGVPRWVLHVCYYGTFGWVFGMFLLVPPRSRRRATPYIQLVKFVICSVLAVVLLYPVWSYFEWPDMAFPFAYVLLALVATFATLSRPIDSQNEAETAPVVADP